MTTPARVAAAAEDWLWGAAIPEADGWINPHRVSVTGTRGGAERRVEVLGEGAVVVRRRVVEWEAALDAQPGDAEPCAEFGQHPRGGHAQAVRDNAAPRCQNVSPSPWGQTQCALLAGHDGRHAYSPSEEGLG